MFFVILSFILIACSAPQVTATLPPPTDTPIPTPTLHPKFIVLQDQIAASGERYSLRADGQIYDGETPIPGMTVTPDGTMTLTVDGKEIALDPADVDFDDEKGITIKGYELTDTNGDGKPDAWVEAVQTFTDQYGLEVVLSDQTLEDGSVVIDEILPPEKYDDNEAAQVKWLKYFEAKRLGFDEGATQWVKTPEGKIQLVDTSDPTKVIAEYRYIPWLDLSGVVWNWKNFVEADGENVLFDVCKIWELMRKGGAPVDKDGVLDFMKALDARESSMVSGGYDIMYGNGNDIKLGTRGGSISPEDGESIVAYRQLRYSNNEGFLVTRDAKENSIILYLENMEWDFYAH